MMSTKNPVIDRVWIKHNSLLSSWDSIAHIHVLTTSAKLNFQDLSALLHDPLLFSKPAVVRDPLGEEGVLKLPLGTYLFRARNAGSDFEEAHTSSVRL